MALADALRAGFGAVRRSKRLIACSALATGVVALPFAVWVGRQAHAAGARRPDAKEISSAFDPDFFADVRAANPSFDADLAALVVAALVAAFVVRPLVWGGYVGIAATGKRLGFARFIREGGSVYWKFLRVSAAQVLLVYLLSVALKPVLRTFEDFAADAPGEDVAILRRQVAQGLVFVVLCVVPLVADYARVGIRMRRRPGVLAELGRAALFVVQHPVRTGVPFLVALVLEVAVCAPLLLLIRVADGAYVRTSVAVLVLGQAAVTVREAARLFHVAAAWSVRASDERSAGAAQARQAGDDGDLLGERMPWHVG